MLKKMRNMKRGDRKAAGSRYDKETKRNCRGNRYRLVSLEEDVALVCRACSVGELAVGRINGRVREREKVRGRTVTKEGDGSERSMGRSWPLSGPSVVLEGCPGWFIDDVEVRRKQDLSY